MTNYKDTEEFLHDLVVDEAFISDLIYLEVVPDPEKEKIPKVPSDEYPITQIIYTFVCDFGDNNYTGICVETDE